jgi:cell division septation protein DedD
VNAAKPVVAPSASTTITTHIQAAPASAPVVTAVVERDPVDPGRAPAVELFHDPVPGATYVQVGALDPGVAEVYVEVLRRKGFEAFGAPGPNKDTIRVLVGPMPNSNAVNEAREKLAASGFQSFARTYPVIVSR